MSADWLPKPEPLTLQQRDRLIAAVFQRPANPPVPRLTVEQRAQLRSIVEAGHEAEAWIEYERYAMLASASATMRVKELAEKLRMSERLSARQALGGHPDSVDASVHEKPDEMPVIPRVEPRDASSPKVRIDNLQRAINAALAVLPPGTTGSEVFDYLAVGNDDTGYVRGRDGDDLAWETSLGKIKRTARSAFLKRFGRRS